MKTAMKSDSQTSPPDGSSPDGVNDIVREMFARDRASSRLFGMTVESARDGFAQVSLTVSDEMLNGHAICHGGVIFSLADSAFAFASNGGGESVVAAGCDINFVKPVPPGTRLTAVCTRRHRRGRSGIYDAEVTNGDGEPVAFFRGRGRRVDAGTKTKTDGGTS